MNQFGLDDIEQKVDSVPDLNDFVANFMAATEEDQMLFLDTLFRAMKALGEDEFRSMLSGMAIFNNADIMDAVSIMNEYLGIEE